MELEWILKIVLVGVIHWMLVILVLPDLVSRHRVVGRKRFWAVAILFLTCFGSLAYLMAHPQVLTQSHSEEVLCREKKEDYDGIVLHFLVLG